MWNKIKSLAAVSFMAAALVGCNDSKTDEQTIKVGTISGPETEMMVVAKDYAKQKYNLDIEIVEFQDYGTTDAAVADKSIDANASQTIQFFEEWKKTTGNTQLISVANTFIYPMGIYSDKIKSLSELKNGDAVAIPNDPSNEERALLLLEKAGLLTLKKTDKAVTVNDIESNPKELKISALATAQLPRVLNDVVIAVINTNYAVPAGLIPSKDALFVEGNDSPYANLIITREELKDDPRVLHLVEAYHSQGVVDKAEELFKGGAIPAWK
jgi:D-methionine transport system substrate-binding protein